MSQLCSIDRYMDLLAIGGGLAALILGAAIGWLFARSRFTRTIAELNTSLVLERSVNKQLSEAVQFDAVPSWSQAPAPTMSDEPVRGPTVLSG
jgi:hypothetical protein